MKKKERKCTKEIDTLNARKIRTWNEYERTNCCWKQ